MQVLATLLEQRVDTPSKSDLPVSQPVSFGEAFLFWLKLGFIKRESVKLDVPVRPLNSAMPAAPVAMKHP